MKTILVDAWNTFVTEDGVNEDLQNFLEQYENPKIIVTNANEDQKISLGIVDMPYEVYSLAHNPDKDSPVYFEKFFAEFGLTKDDVVYFEHNEDAVKCGKSLGIPTFWYQKWEDNREKLKTFFENNL